MLHVDVDRLYNLLVRYPPLFPIGAGFIFLVTAAVLTPDVASAYTLEDDANVVVTVEDLQITPHVEKEEYCQDRSGVDQVRLTVGFTYANKGSRTIIVPIVTRLAEVQVHGEAMKPLRLPYKLSKLQGISPTIYTAPEPSPELFYLLSPGRSQEGLQQLVILRLAARGAKSKRSALSPGEYRLGFDLNVGSRLPNDPYVPSGRWKDTGVLIVGRHPAEAIRIRISEANATPCQPPRVIM